MGTENDSGKVDLAAVLQGLLQKHGNDGARLAESLLRENHGYRRKLATAKTEIEETKKKAMPEGAVVLSADQAKAWDAYQKLGKAEDLQKALEELPKLKEQAATSARERLIAEAAKLTGFDSDVLSGLAGKLELEMKETQKDGKAVRIALVKDGGAEKPLEEYAAEKWAKFMPALKPGNGSSGGTPYVSQSSGGKAPKTDMVDQFIDRERKRAESRTNPLLPQQVKTGA